MTESYHKSNLGSFGEGLQADLDGYVHLTKEGWLNAPMDAMTKMDDEQASELAEAAVDATKQAEEGLEGWQSK